MLSRGARLMLALGLPVALTVAGAVLPGSTVVGTAQPNIGIPAPTSPTGLAWAEPGAPAGQPVETATASTAAAPADGTPSPSPASPSPGGLTKSATTTASPATSSSASTPAGSTPAGSAPASAAGAPSATALITSAGITKAAAPSATNAGTANRSSTNPGATTPGTSGRPTASGSPASRTSARPSASPSPAQTTTSPGVTAGTVGAGPQVLSGWRTDFYDGFDAPIETTGWTRYGWNNPPVGHGGMGTLKQSNVYTSNGNLVLRTAYENGAWSSGGVSSGDFFSTPGGRWEIRAKFPQAKGIGYVFLLYPNDGTWPPEIDIAEGRVNGPEVMATYHWDDDNKQQQRWLQQPDMSGWHTYGVIIEGDRLIYTFDGQPWAEVVNPAVTKKSMWVGFQCAAMDPNGSARAYETVDGGVPNARTPAENLIQIDWVAHYVKA